MGAYRQIYSSALAPVQAYVASPHVIAPVSPPWPLNNPTAATQRYLGALSNHDGYISPDAGAHLQSVRNNVRTVVEHANSPNARAYQRKPARRSPPPLPLLRHNWPSWKLTKLAFG